MDKETKKTVSAGNKKIKTVIIMTSVGLCVALILAFLFYLPEMNAKKALSDFTKALTSGDITRVVLSRQQAFSSGSFDEVTASFEKALSEDELTHLTELIENFASYTRYTGSAAGLAGTNDYRLTVTAGGERFHLYVSDEYVYTLEGSLRTCFEDRDGVLHSYLESLKNAHFAK